MPFCSPEKIIVGNRFRSADIHDPAVKEMADSIKECGQLQPILVTKDMNLVAGLHRLLACTILEKEVWWVGEVEGKLLFESPAQIRRAELQENIKRKEFTPMQLSLGTAELHRLMTETYEENKSGPGLTECWTQSDTAKMLGYKSHASISDALTVAKAIETKSIPALTAAKTMQEAVKMVRDKIRIEASVELARRAAENDIGEVVDPQKFFGEKIILGDCLEQIKKLRPGICSLFITDPPFGIDLDKLLRERGEILSNVQTVYADNKDDILTLVSGVITEIARVGKPSCQVVMFCGVQYWHLMAKWFEDVGFKVFHKPLLWVKVSKEFKIFTGRTNNPATHPGSSYEAAVYAWRGSATLAKQGLSDVFIHPPTESGIKFHVAQKPVQLMEEIIERFYHPNTNPLLIDPFAGSGSTLVAARRVGLKSYFGYELNPEFRERAVANLINCYVEDLKKEQNLDVGIEIDLGDFD